MNLLHAIGALLMIGGFSAFLIGIARYFLPGVERYIPKEFKKSFTIGSGVFITLAGMLLLKI